MATTAEEYKAKLHAAFAKLLESERRLAEAEGVLQKTTAPLQMDVLHANNAIKAHWIEIRNLMDEAGVVEENVPGEAIDGNTLSDYRIAYSTPPRKVIIPDDAGVPDEFVKIERTPKRKEILEYLRYREDAKLPLPNWAGLDRAEPKLQWRPIKKGK